MDDSTPFTFSFETLKSIELVFFGKLNVVFYDLNVQICEVK